MRTVPYAIDKITSEAGYSALFKAFIVIAALYMITLIKVAGLALPIESDAHKLKYAVEYELKKEIDFSDLECKFEMKSYQDCKLAIYKKDIITISLKALVVFQELLKGLAFLTGMLSAIGFVGNPYIHEAEEKT